jgi:dTDP-4-dehydrorhamnose 3,5-epimerase
MSYKNHTWNFWDIDFLKTFGEQVPVYSPAVYREFRGEIFTTYHNTEHPVNNVIDDNCVTHTRFSKSYQGVLRGLHYDFKTWKLVQALVGDIYLMVLDMRDQSSTYGKWESYILSEKTRDQVLIPPGFANGHYALTDCIFHYNLFYPGSYVDEAQQYVVKWNDIRFNMEWPSETPILQKRDR